MGRAMSLHLLLLLLILLLLDCNPPLFVRAIPSPHTLPGFCKVAWTEKSLLFFYRWPLFRSSRTLPSPEWLSEVCKYKKVMFTLVSSSGITDVIMDFPESRLVKLDFCGTKLSRHVSGLPTMSNAPRDQRRSKLKTHAMLLNSSASLAGFNFHHLVLTCVGCLIILMMVSFMPTLFFPVGASPICGFAMGITIAETTVTRGTVRT